MIDDSIKIFSVGLRLAAGRLYLVYRYESDRIIIGRVWHAESQAEAPCLDVWSALEEYGPGQEQCLAGRWATGDIRAFLGLDESDLALIDIRLELADLLGDVRYRNRWTQSQIARRSGTPRSQISRLEDADPTVSLELLIAAALRSGASRAELASAIAGRRRRAADRE